MGNATLGQTLRVGSLARDTKGRPVANLKVSLTWTFSNGRVTHSVAYTNALGKAVSALAITTNTPRGRVHVTARVQSGSVNRSATTTFRRYWPSRFRSLGARGPDVWCADRGRRSSEGTPAMLEWLDWKAVKPAQAREILAHLLGIDDADPLARFEVEGSVARLSFYRHWKLVRLSSRFRDGDSETALEDVYALWRTDRPPVLLDGDSDVVHTTNEDESLRLDDAHVLDYVRWFCFAVRAEGGEPFILFEQAPAKVAAKDKAAAKDAKPLTPKGHGPKGAALVEATVIFAKTSFTSVFSVPPDGQIVMIDDDPLTDEFPEALTPVLPPLGLGMALRMHLSQALGTTPTPPTPPPAQPPDEAPDVDPKGCPRPGRRDRLEATRKRRSSRSTIVEMVELLLERALRDQAQNRLLVYFNASLPTANEVQRFAALLSSSSPVVVVETTIPFVEETMSEVVNGALPTGAPLSIYRGDVILDANGQEMLVNFGLPMQGPAIVLIPLQVYRHVMEMERLTFDIAARDLAAFITCERFADLPESVRRFADIVLRLPALDAASFETLFERVIGQPPPATWRAGGTEWVKHLLHTDFEHPRRMQLSRNEAYAFVRSQVGDRLGAVDPVEGLRLDQLYGLGEARQFAEELIADIHAALSGKLAWSQVDRGALLVGAPGTGKTTLAKAIAKDCGIKFIQGSAAGWMAEGVSLGPHIQAIRRTFSEARAYAPSILFIDEIDSLGSREQMTGDRNSIYQTEVINAVLEQIQGLDPAAPVFVIGATNHEENVDPALRRAGRLDRVIRIPRPNSDGLDHIYQYYIGLAGRHDEGRSPRRHQGVGRSLGRADRGGRRTDRAGSGTAGSDRRPPDVAGRPDRGDHQQAARDERNAAPQPRRTGADRDARSRPRAGRVPERVAWRGHRLRDRRAPRRRHARVRGHAARRAAVPHPRGLRRAAGRLPGGPGGRGAQVRAGGRVERREQRPPAGHGARHADGHPDRAGRRRTPALVGHRHPGRSRTCRAGALRILRTRAREAADARRAALVAGRGAGRAPGTTRRRGPGDPRHAQPDHDVAGDHDQARVLDDRR